MKKPTISIEIPEYLQAAVNTLVRYYSEGWRAGYLEGFTKMGAAIIRPIGAIGGTKPQTVNVEFANVRLIDSLEERQQQWTKHVELVNSKPVTKTAPEPEPERHPEKVVDAVLEMGAKPKRKKREKTTEPTTEEMRKTLIKEFVDDNPLIDCLVKKTKRGCRL